MNKKNGFTLIELLAVILILGIIALIAIPTVSKIIGDAKKGAFETSLKNIEKKANDNCSMQQLKSTAYTTSYTITNGEISPSLDIKGKLPNGTINVNSDCNVTYQLSDNTYTGVKNDPNGTVVITKGNNVNTVPLYIENTLNGADPVLDNSMIPVTIDNNGTVKKADIYSEWYKYNNGINNSKWANAVITTQSSRGDYKSANANTTINQSDILAYLVWIPRFSYSIPTVSDANNPPLINIEFENKNTTKKTGDAVSTLYSHPAFTFDGKELNGIWVAKFETTGTSDAPTVLPNAASLVDQTLNAQFTTANKFTEYGVSGDPHIMKDLEWGVVAYLSHSKYGSNEEIRINNYYKKGTLTGCGASSNNADGSTTCGIQYGSSSNYPQSTTNNVSGIFDMSGGTWERVMGNYKNSLGSSGFEKMPDVKYYDLYTGPNDVITYETACNNGLCKGHANYETNGWYSDSNYPVNSSYPWVYRGGDYGNRSGVGIFNTNYNSGSNSDYISFRLVVTNKS